MRSFILVNSAPASSKSGLRRMASISNRSTRGMRLCASGRVKRLAMSNVDDPALYAGHLNRERPAAGPIELCQDNALPSAEQHRRITDLQTEALTHNHSA